MLQAEKAAKVKTQTQEGLGLQQGLKEMCMNRKKTEREQRHKEVGREVKLNHIKDYTFYVIYNEIRKIKDIFEKQTKK